MRINQNIAAFNAYRNLNQTQNQLSSSLEKLSSGFRINRAADDASGLVNSENLRSQIGGLKVATRNAQDAISLVQTAEGAQTEVHSILQRMRDLTVQSGNLGTNDASALKANQDEIGELVEELNRIADQTQFGTKKILDGTFAQSDAVIEIADTAVTPDTTTEAGDGTDPSEVVLDDLGLPAGYVGDVTLNLTDADGPGASITFAAGATSAEIAAALNASEDFGDNYVADVDGDGNLRVTTTDDRDDALDFTAENVEQEAADAEVGAVFQVGANATQQVSVGIAAVSAEGLGVDGIDVNPDGGLTQEVVDQALLDIDAAISTVSENRATLGAFQNRMESTIRNVSVAVENLSAAESRIRDTDMADEMVNFTRNQILSQAGTAMLAQANQVPQSVLQLLG